MSSELGIVFENFPREIRDEIYKIAVKAARDIFIVRGLPSRFQKSFWPVPKELMFAKSPIPGILHLNRKIREEAITIFYNLNTFRIQGRDDLIRFINFVGVTGSKNIRTLRLSTRVIEESHLHKNSNDHFHVDMLSKLYCITIQNDKECSLPQHAGLDQSIASLAKWDQLKCIAIEYRMRQTGFSDFENDFIHSLCLFHQYKQKKNLSLSQRPCRQGSRLHLYDVGPLYSIRVNKLGDRHERLRWLYNEVLQILLECGHEASKIEHEFYEKTDAEGGQWAP